MLTITADTPTVPTPCAVTLGYAPRQNYTARYDLPGPWVSQPYRGLTDQPEWGRCCPIEAVAVALETAAEEAQARTDAIHRLYFIRHRTTGRLAEGLDRRPLSWPSSAQARAYLDAQRPERAEPGVATWADQHEVAGVIVGGAAKGEAS